MKAEFCIALPAKQHWLVYFSYVWAAFHTSCDHKLLPFYSFVWVGDTMCIFFFILIFLKIQFDANRFLINKFSKDVYKNVTILVKKFAFFKAFHNPWNVITDIIDICKCYWTRINYGGIFETSKMIFMKYWYSLFNTIFHWIFLSLLKPLFSISLFIYVVVVYVCV